MIDPLSKLYEQIIIKEFTESTISKLVTKFSSDASEEEIRKELNDFEKYKNGITKKDPFQYKTWIEFTEAIHAAKGKAEFKRGNKSNQGEINKNDIIADDNIADDENVTIYKGDSQDKCVMYGRGYTFCISRPIGGNMFSSYRLGKSSTFYFIYFKTKPKSAKDHIMVLDHTTNGYEWTFADNNTEKVKGGWQEIVAKYPELAPYEKLLVNKKLTSSEEDTIKQIRAFGRTQTIEEFNSFDYSTKVQAVKSVINLNDDIFDTLDSNLRNEFISIGPNLTTHQADSLKENEIKRYIATRDVSFQQLDDGLLYKFNKHDLNVKAVQLKIESDTKKAEQLVAEESYNFKSLFITNLPKGIPNVVEGDFVCAFNQLLTSLEGAPQEVGNSFYCTNNRLKSLRGGPQKVGGNYYCSNNQLTSLEGAPREVGDSFFCKENQLTSLKGAPQEVGGNFYCTKNQLKSLKGAPQKVGGDFDCSKNPLTSLEGAPQKVGDSFVCRDNQLTSLEGAPQKVGDSFVCSNNQLTSLRGAPQQVGGAFVCSNNQLTSLRGAPQEVGGDFICSYNQLTSLRGAPQEVGGDFICSYNQLTSLEGAPQEVRGDFDCSKNQLTSLKGISQVGGRIISDLKESVKYTFNMLVESITRIHSPSK